MGRTVHGYVPLDGDWERDGKGIGNNTHIKELYVGSDVVDRSNADGFETFSRGLAINKSIEHLRMCCSIFDRKIFSMLCPFIEQNYNLRSLSVNGGIFHGWDIFSTVICNESSITATFNSNHTLQYVHGLPVPREMQALLKLNRENTRFDAARRKIIKVHFNGADISIQPFIDMNLKDLPHAVAWMARDEYGSSLLYQFVRNTNLFHDIRG
jgi:hypothetical protein